MTELHGRKIAFPEAKSFHDLFDDVKAHKTTARTLLVLPSWESGTWSDRGERTKFRVGGFCMVSGQSLNYGLDVSAKPTLLDWIKENMLRVSNDTTHFKAICWGDGRALVTISHSQIIGGHYLAVIDTATIPGEMKP